MQNTTVTKRNTTDEIIYQDENEIDFDKEFDNTTSFSSSEEDDNNTDNNNNTYKNKNQNTKGIQDQSQEQQANATPLNPNTMSFFKKLRFSVVEKKD